MCFAGKFIIGIQLSRDSTILVSNNLVILIESPNNFHFCIINRENNFILFEVKLLLYNII
jgi:hypothetical protein